MLAFHAIGSGSGGGTAPIADYPAGIQAGDLLILMIENKYPPNAPVNPTGWKFEAQISGGSGVAGPGTGQVTTTVYTKVADGTETGSLALSIPSGNSSVARIMSVRSDRGGRIFYDIAVGTAAQNTGNTVNWSSTTSQNMELTVDDFMVAVNGININTYTYTPYTFTQTGTTFGARNQRTSTATSGGGTSRLQVATCSVTAGGANLPVTYGMTSSGSAVDNPAGSTVILRIREKRKQFFNLC
jgi:hypothetical protein